MYLGGVRSPFTYRNRTAEGGRAAHEGKHVMDADQGTIEPFDPAHNLADTAPDLEDDDRDDDAVETGAPVLVPAGGGTDG